MILVVLSRAAATVAIRPTATTASAPRGGRVSGSDPKGDLTNGHPTYAPDRIRTCGLSPPEATLYPAELRAQAVQPSPSLSHGRTNVCSSGGAIYLVPMATAAQAAMRRRVGRSGCLGAGRHFGVLIPFGEEQPYDLVDRSRWRPAFCGSSARPRVTRRRLPRLQRPSDRSWPWRRGPISASPMSFGDLLRVQRDRGLSDLPSTQSRARGPDSASSPPATTRSWESVLPPTMRSIAGRSSRCGGWCRRRDRAPINWPSRRLAGMDLSVAFLGTGGAVPSARRSTASVLVSRGGERLLFDCGEGTQRQMQRSLGLVQLDEIYLTHFHADHFLGLPGLLKTYDLTDRDQPLTIYGPAGLEDLFRTLGRLVGRLGFPLDLVEIEPGRQDRHRGRRDPAVPGRAQRSRLRLRAGRGSSGPAASTPRRRSGSGSPKAPTSPPSRVARP